MNNVLTLPKKGFSKKDESFFIHEMDEALDLAYELGCREFKRFDVSFAAKGENVTMIWREGDAEIFRGANYEHFYTVFVEEQSHWD